MWIAESLEHCTTCSVMEYLEALGECKAESVHCESLSRKVQSPNELSEVVANTLLGLYIDKVLHYMDRFRGSKHVCRV